MTRKLPRYTLPLIHFGGFSAQTHTALNRYFEAGAAEDKLPRALILTSSGYANSDHPWRVRFAHFQNEEFGIFDAFEGNETVSDLAAIAAFHLSHDPLVDRVQAPMSRHSRGRHHNRYAVTDRGILSWSWRSLAAMRDDPEHFQRLIDEGGKFLAYSFSKHVESAHQTLEVHERLGPLARQIYRTDFASLTKKEQIGNHKDAEFSLRPVSG